MRQSLIDLNNIASLPMSVFLPDEEQLEISSVIKKLEQKYEGIVQLSPVDLRRLYQRVTQSYLTKNDSLISAKETKYLPLLLFWGKEDEHIIQDAGFTSYLLHLIQRRNKVKSTLMTLIREYLCHYSMSLQGIPLMRVRAFILEGLESLESSGKRLKKWKELSFIFYQDSYKDFANLISRQQDIRAFIDQLELESPIRWGGFMKAVTGEFFASDLIPNVTKLAALEPLFEAGFEHRESPFIGIMYLSANSLIPWASTNEVRDNLRRFYLRHFRDPRLAGSLHWNEVSPSVKKLFIQWLSSYDLNIFFEIIHKTASDPGWEYRRKFWEAYLPYFESTWVVLGPDARRYVEQYCRYDDRKFLCYSKLIHGTSDQSCFMFEIKGYVFIEWSNTGALRVWKKDSSPVQIGDEYYEVTEIRQDGVAYRKPHMNYITYNWQNDVAQWLRINCQISPSKSYRL